MDGRAVLSLVSQSTSVIAITLTDRQIEVCFEVAGKGVLRRPCSGQQVNSSSNGKSGDTEQLGDEA